MDKYKQKRNEYNKRDYWKYPVRRREQHNLRNKKTKLEVFTHYGGNPPKCSQCGITDIRVLTIDHINNDGAKHRREIGSYAGTSFYLWLRVHNYPEGYQVLCWNCNWIKRLEMK